MAVLAYRLRMVILIAMDLALQEPVQEPVGPNREVLKLSWVAH